MNKTLLILLTSIVASFAFADTELGRNLLKKALIDNRIAQYEYANYLAKEKNTKIQIMIY